VPPIHAPPITGPIPEARTTIGWTTIDTTVKISDSPIASDSSSFFARQAAAVATAAETPQTDISAEITIFNEGDGMRKMR
jgi:hypothetical protein